MYHNATYHFSSILSPIYVSQCIIYGSSTSVGAANGGHASLISTKLPLLCLSLTPHVLELSPPPPISLIFAYGCALSSCSTLSTRIYPHSNQSLLIPASSYMFQALPSLSYACNVQSDLLVWMHDIYPYKNHPSPINPQSPLVDVSSHPSPLLPSSMSRVWPPLLANHPSPSTSHPP